MLAADLNAYDVLRSEKLVITQPGSKSSARAGTKETIMSEKSFTEVLVRPLLTERGTNLQEKHNQYPLRDPPEATKTDIKKAVEKLFKVKVEKVRTMIMPRQVPPLRQGRGRSRPTGRRPIVTVKKGQKIDFAATGQPNKEEIQCRSKFISRTRRRAAE